MELSSGGLPLGETSPGDYGVRWQTECDAALAYVEEASTWMGFFGRIECGDVTPELLTYPLLKCPLFRHAGSWIA
jgi:hypothetical protein